LLTREHQTNASAYKDGHNTQKFFSPVSFLGLRQQSGESEAMAVPAGSKGTFGPDATIKPGNL